MADGIVLAANDSGERPSIRVAFCITDLDVGGAERMFVELVTRLDRHHWEPRVFCLSGPGALAERLQASGIPVTCFGAKSVRNLGVSWRLAAELKKFRPAARFRASCFTRTSSADSPRGGPECLASFAEFVWPRVAVVSHFGWIG